MSTFFSSLSPIDDAVVWSGESSPADEIARCMSRATLAATIWRSTPLEERIEVVRRYAKYLTDHRDEISDLIVREVSKLSWDASGEAGAAIAKAASLILFTFRLRL